MSPLTLPPHLHRTPLVTASRAFHPCFNSRTRRRQSQRPKCLLSTFLFVLALMHFSLLFPFSLSFVCPVSRPVNSRLCAAEEPPSAVQRCSVPCQRRCLLSQWSPWGACLHDSCNEPQGRRGTTWRTCGETRRNKLPFQAPSRNVIKKKKKKKERSVLKDVFDAPVVDKHVAVSRGKTPSLSSKVLAVL